MRVSMHNGRNGSARHNDRDFELTHAEHIDASRSAKNKYWQLPKYQGMSFDEMELAFYQDTFSDGLSARNERYKAQRHAERCKSVESLLRNAKTRPEEQILTIGSRNDGVDVDAFAACMNEYAMKMNEWSHNHGVPFVVLNVAVHGDEKGAAHAHLRRVWIAEDKDGNKIPSQNKALKKARVPAPNPFYRETRRNNRKVAFDKFARSVWQQVCRSHGFEIETDPLKTDRKHMSTADFIRADTAKAEARAENLRQEVSELERQKADFVEWSEDLEWREHEISKREKTIEVQESLLKKIVADLPQNLLKIAKSDNLKVKKNVISKIDADLRKLNMPSVIDAIIAQNAPVAGSQIPEERTKNDDNDWNMMTVFDREEEERKAVLREI